MNMRKILVLLVLTLSFSEVFAQKQADLDVVVSTEKAFAAMAAEKGTGTAFVEYAAENGLVFNQKPANAREVYRNIPANPSLLAWTPNFFGVSSTGELGFTTGNWSFHPKGKTDTPTSFGEFATIWKRQPDGKYRFVVDMGIQHAKYETEIVPQSPNLAGKTNKQNDSQNWQELETNFASSLQKNGVAETYKRFLGENSRLLRQNHFPIVTKKEALKVLSVEKSNLTTKTLGGELSGDLAYAYGNYELTDSSNKTEKGYFLRVWRQEGKNWRIALDVLHPIPPK